MAFKKLTGTRKTTPAKTKTTDSRKPKRGTGNYNILSFGTSQLKIAPRSAKYDYIMSFNVAGSGVKDEDGREYSFVETLFNVFAGLTSTKNGRSRGSNHYFFENKNKADDKSPDYTGSCRLDVKLNEADSNTVTQRANEIIQSLIALHNAPELFEEEKVYINLARVFLDEGQGSYAYKARVLFYNKPYIVDGIAEFDVSSLAALAIAHCFSKPISGCLFYSDRVGVSGSLSVQLNKDLYKSIQELCVEMGLDTNASEEPDPEPRTYDLESDEEDDFPPY